MSERAITEIGRLSVEELALARERIVEAFCVAFEIDGERVEDVLMPDVDSLVRGVLGHTGWVAWVA